MIKNLPVLLVALTALLTTLIVHAGFTLWWAFAAFGKANPPAFDWVGALATSGIATTVVLIGGLVVQRLAGGNVGGVSEHEIDARVSPPAPRMRPASDATVVVPRRRQAT